jgi:radical SAM protein with 4Fe4S-binding SPASM domain
MDCVNIPLVQYGDFAKRLYTNIAAERIPISGSIEITSRCNLRCIHCYIQGTCTENDLTYKEICDIIDQIIDENCMWLVITGGEPLSRPDFKDIYKYVKSKGIITTIFTNATLITPEIADFLAEYPPFSTEITLYGMTPATYNEVTGVRGAFERCIRGIELLRERNLPIKLKSMIMKPNYHELQEMKQYAEKIQVPFKYDCMINGKLDGSLEPTKYRLTPEEIFAIDQADEERMKSLVKFAGKFGSVPESDYLYTCNAGLYNFHISSTGRLSVCPVSREPNYDILQGSFHEGFYEVIPELRAKKRTRYSECQACDLRGICEQCPAWGQLEHNDPEAKVDFLCQVTKLRIASVENYQRLKVGTKQ